MKPNSNQNEQNKKNLTSDKNRKDEPFITNPDYTTTGGKNNKMGGDWGPTNAYQEGSPSEKRQNQTSPKDSVHTPNQYNR